MLVCVCACVYVFLCVCVCVRLVCMCVCVRVCLTSLEDRAWLLVEASSGPGAGGGGGAEGGGEEERGASIWRSFQSVWCLHAAMQDASTQAQHSLRREAWSGGGASCWDGSLSPFLLADSSLFFHPTVVSNCIHCKSPGTTFIILPGTPEICRGDGHCDSGVPGKILNVIPGNLQ